MSLFFTYDYVGQPVKKPNHIRKLLFSEIKSVVDRVDEFCLEPGRDFIRKRKLPFGTVIKTVIGMGGKS